MLIAQLLHKLWIFVVAGIVLAMVAAVGCSQGSADTDTPLTSDTGYRDLPFSGTDTSGEQELLSGPTGEKNQSKLWFNDGAWWGILYDRSADDYHIHRYDWASHTWNSISTLVDERPRSRADVLWDGDHLYVVSAGPDSSSAKASARLLRYDYDKATKRYSLDAGFPVTITSGGMESIVLEKDTTGKLWVTYTQHGRLYVSHTLGGDDLRWTNPFVLPVEGSTVTPEEDISSLVAFDSKIGLMWSNQVDDAMYFATHQDGEPEDTWQTSTVVEGPGMANDHINLKADSGGRVFAALKTSFDRGEDPFAPLVTLMVREPDEAWTSYLFGRVNEDHARPIVLLDEEHGHLYMFAQAPRTGGKIYYKRTSLEDFSFEEGLGTPFIQGPDETGSNVGDATSTKQNLDGSTGLLVEASDKTSDYYLHNTLDLNATQ